MRHTTKFSKSGSNLGTTIRQSLKMMAGKDVPNYTLIFLDPTTQNKRGESKNIVVPYIVLGRNSSCNIQYDENYSTVSRQHAAIQIDQDGCTLIHNPSATNPTLVDGKPISGPFKLGNGDEIQLSHEGPKLRFLMEQRQGQVSTSTMGFTRRMSMAMGQAMRPYRRALAIVGILLIAAVGVAIWSATQLSSSQSEMQASMAQSMDSIGTEIDKTSADMNRTQAEMDVMKSDYDKVVSNLDSIKLESAKRRKANSRAAASAKSAATKNETQNIANDLTSLEESIYYIQPVSGKFKLYVQGVGVSDEALTVFNEILNENLWSGTGFLTTDRRFVTARHVIEPWLYESSSDGDCNLFTALNSFILLGQEVEVTFQAVNSKGDSFQFTYDDMRFDKTSDKDVTVDCYGEEINVKSVSSYKTDWAYVEVGNRQGKIEMDRNLSSQLNKREKLYVLGYPLGLRIQDWKNLDPSYSEATVSQRGIKNGLLYVSGMSFTGGNSGGPIFAKRDGRYKAVGIVSHSAGGIGGVVPTANIR